MKKEDKKKLKNILNEEEKLQLDDKLIITILERRIKELERYIEGNQAFIQLEIYDKDTKTKHIIGTSPHDCLLVENGKVEYYNLQNGCGTPDTYEFVEKELHGGRV